MAPGARRGERFERVEAFPDPVAVPVVARRLVEAEAGEMLHHAQIVERMDVGGDRHRQGDDMGPIERIGGQERRIGKLRDRASR